MARRKTGFVVLGVVGVAALAGVTLMDGGGSKVKLADAGGGPMPAASGEPAPYSVSTLPPVGSAAQDPGGGGGGTGDPGYVGPPGIQGERGPGSAQGPGGNDGRLYLSGTNLLDPNRAAATSGTSTVPNPLVGVGGIIDLPGGGGTTTGCADEADEVDYYAIPLVVETVGFTGTPAVDIRISGSGPVSATLYQMSPDGDCLSITSGSGSINGGRAQFGLGGVGKFQYRKGFTPVLVISAPGSHTISTDGVDPSSVILPGLYGV